MKIMHKKLKMRRQPSAFQHYIEYHFYTNTHTITWSQSQLNEFRLTKTFIFKVDKSLRILRISKKKWSALIIAYLLFYRHLYLPIFLQWLGRFSDIERHFPWSCYINRACNSDYSRNYQLIMITHMTMLLFVIRIIRTSLFNNSSAKIIVIAYRYVLLVSSYITSV